MNDNLKISKIKKLSSLIKNASYTVVFTGAGMSSESGIPPFRGAQGLWNYYDPIEASSIEGFYNNPNVFWAFIRDLLKKGEVKPHLGHFVLAELEAAGFIKTVITQNIDLLHQEAGSKNVLPIHGSLEKATCLDCGDSVLWSSLFPEVMEQIPVCKKCSSAFVKPDIVFFGEALPQKLLATSVAEAQKADLFIVIGSSLEVYPAAQIPYLAKQSNASLVLLNLESTALDRIFDLCIYGRCGENLTRLKQVLSEGEKF